MEAFGGFKSMDDRSRPDKQEIKSPEPKEMPLGEQEGAVRTRREELALKVTGANARKPLIISKKLTLAHMF